MPLDPGSPSWPSDASQPLIAQAEPPPKKRPAWIGWAVGVGVVVIAAGAFFVAKSAAGGGGSSPAAASSANPAGNAGGGQNGGFQGRFPGAAGEITAIDGTTLTVQDQQNQSVKVTTTDSTRVTVQKTVAVVDIAKGDRISVMGTQSGTTIAADDITIMDPQANGGPQGNGPPGGATPGNGSLPNLPEGGAPPGGFPGGGGPPSTDANGNPTGNGGGANGQPPGGFAFGTVTKVDGDTITISSFDGSMVKVTTTSSTTVTKSMQGAFSDLEVGQNIRAIGEIGSDGTVAATSINEGAGGFGGFRGGRPGQGTP